MQRTKHVHKQLRLGERLKSARKKARISRDELAGALGIDVSVLCRIENCKIGMSVDRVVDIARILGISLPMLFRDLPTQRRSRSAA